MSNLDQQFRALQQSLAKIASLGLAQTNAATNFAIDANAAGRADLTLALLEPLAVRAPNVAKIWQLLGLAWREEQDMEKAAAAFERARALAPQDLRIALGKAQVAHETGRPAAALFQAIRKAAPLDGELALSTATALVHEGDPAAGEQLIADLVAQEPAWHRGLDALATMRWMAGDTINFDRAFAESARKCPTDYALRFAWYRAVAQVGQWDKAEAIIAEARRDFGDRIELDAIEASAAAEQGDEARAEALYNRLETLDNLSAKVGHIRHCLRTGQLDRACALTAPLLQTPGAVMVWPYASTIWRLQGDPRAAWLDGDPPFIRHYDLPVSDQELAKLADVLRRLHLMQHHPPEQSLRGGTQTQGHLLLRLEPELLAIRALILDAVRDYVAGLPPFMEGHPLLGTPRDALHYAGAWSVRLAAQGFHVVHTHPFGWISSAFYVALPERMGPGNSGWLQLGAPPPELRLDLLPYAEIEPKPGRLALFPSTMWHGTVPFDDGERLTIAFDMRVPSR